MNNLINKINALANVSAQLEPTEHGRDELLKQVQGFAHQWINHLTERKSYYEGSPNRENLVIDGQAKELSQLVKTYQTEVAQKGISAASGGHLGYIPGGSVYTAALGDFLAAISNEYAGMYYGSPGGVAVEEAVLTWLKQVYGFPESAIGNLTSGGSIASLIALTAARDHYGISGDKIAKSVVYLTEQTHHCLHKALRIIGLGAIQLRHIAMDEGFRMIPEALQTQITEDKQNGLTPFLVIASGGTTDTGAVDALEQIGEVGIKLGLLQRKKGLPIVASLYYMISII